MMSTKSNRVVRILRPPHVSIACSICGATFAVAASGVEASAENSSRQHQHPTTATGTSTSTTSTAQRRHPLPLAPPTPPLARIGLESSFVNIPRSSYQQPSIGGNNIHDIESILDHALRFSSNTNTAGGGSGSSSSILQNSTGANMHEVTRRMDALLESTMAIMSNNSAMEDNNHSSQGYYCQSCLGMISQALDTCTELFNEECIDFDKTASSEEERAYLMCNVLSANADTTRGLPLDDVADCQNDDNDAIHHAIDLFQSELDALSQACKEQCKELRVLQNLMQNQIDRSQALSDQEDMIHQELNSLEIDAHTFEEESHLIIHSCRTVENEINAMSHVKLLSLPFTIRIHDGEGDKDDYSKQYNTVVGRYPTINNLRLAYRINTKAGLHQEEINAAFFHASQLMAFTLGLYPSFKNTVIRIIPIHPCAKILVNLPEGQTVHNLGFDTTNSSGAGSSGQPNHVPTQSITLFLALLSEVTAHILISDRNQRRYYVDDPPPKPPFSMTELSIDNVDVTKLADSNTSSWLSVVFCIAANLRWLSELQFG